MPVTRGVGAWAGVGVGEVRKGVEYVVTTMETRPRVGSTQVSNYNPVRLKLVRFPGVTPTHLIFKTPVRREAFYPWQMGVCLNVFLFAVFCNDCIFTKEGSKLYKER